MNWLKKIIAALLVLAAIGIIAFFYFDRPLPRGLEGAAADRFARRMMAAVGHDAWQKTGAISWRYAGRHQYLWDIDRRLARVRWAEHEVLLHTGSQEGIAFSNGVRVEDSRAQPLITEAWKKWINDSFWLNPISKFFDPGTSRSLVTTDDGKQALLVHHGSGGATPGDSYLWFVDSNYLPVKWQMWTSIIPVGGLAASWDDWISTQTGAKISTRHHILFFDLQLTEIKAAGSLENLVAGADPFKNLISDAE